jgi:hypothetical protein
MFSDQVQVLDFTTEDWLRLGHLLRRAPSRPAAAGPGEGGILAIRSGERVIKVLSLARGRQPPPEAPAPASGLARQLAERHGARFALVFTPAGLEQLSDRFSRRLTQQQSFYAQLEAMMQGIRELESEGELELWPTPFAEWPFPTERALAAALDAVCPPGKSLIVAAFEGAELYTSVALRREAQGFEFMLGPARLRRDVGLLSGDFLRDYRYVGAAVENRLGPLALGCYAELSTFQRLAGSEQPGAWATAVAARDVVLTPVTRGVALPLGLDVGRAVFALARSLVSRVGAFDGVAAPPLAPALKGAYALVEGDVRRYLGFDPWRLFVRLFG